VTSFALDSSAVLAWVLQEVGRWAVVNALVTAPDADPILPGPVLTEVIKAARARGNVSSAHQVASTLSAYGMRVELNTEQDLVRAAELLELSAANPSVPHPVTGKQATLSLGDGLILAAVERLAVPVVTNDRYWRQFVDAGHTSANVQAL
jgi:PIN domain nuclease of toxin-antitoxin system